MIIIFVISMFCAWEKETLGEKRIVLLGADFKVGYPMKTKLILK